MKNTFTGALRCMGSGYNPAFLYLNATATTVSLGPIPQVFTFTPAVYPITPPVYPLTGADYVNISFLLPGNASPYYLNAWLTDYGKIGLTQNVYSATNTSNPGTLWLLTQLSGNSILNIMAVGGSGNNGQYLYINGYTNSGTVNLNSNANPTLASGTFWLPC